MKMLTVGLALTLVLIVGACSDESDQDVSDNEQAAAEDGSSTSESDEPSADATGDVVVVSVGSCEENAELFVTKGSVNANLADPEVSASCSGDVMTVVSNAIPDYTYIQTSPGDPAPQDISYDIPATPVKADQTTEAPVLGAIAVALNGVPIFGPSEGPGGDVLTNDGLLSECGSHNGPTGFHIHLIGVSEVTDCMFTPDEVAESPQLVGFAFDGYPIYTAASTGYSPSWQLTDESLFATDTWSAHTYVEGSGDLDECNGLTDPDGNYAYYATDTFPYILGCYAGEVDLPEAPGGGGQGGPPGGDDAERPERPELP